MIAYTYEEMLDGFCAGWKATYDERGNKTSFTFCDTDGRPYAFDGHIAGWRIKYNELGKEVSRTMLDTEGKKVEIPDEVKEAIPAELLERMRH